MGEWSQKSSTPSPSSQQTAASLWSGTSGTAQLGLQWYCIPSNAALTDVGTPPGHQPTDWRGAQAALLGADLLPGYVLIRDDPQPPPFKFTFDEQPEKLAYFLTQVWNYLEIYGDRYLNEGVISANPKGEAVE